jgi:hypothetical protein
MYELIPMLFSHYISKYKIKNISCAMTFHQIMHLEMIMFMKSRAIIWICFEYSIF